MQSIELRVLYPDVLPNRHSAAIQTLKTAAAFAARGHRVVVIHAGGPVEPDALCRFYGDVRPDLVSFRATQVRGLMGRWRLAAEASAPADDGRPVFVLGRGPGVLGTMAAPTWRRAALRLYEMHNILWLRDAEKAAGFRSDKPCTRRQRQLLRAETAMIRKADGLVCLTSAVEVAARDIAGPLPPTALLPSGTDLPDLEDGRAPSIDVVYAGKIEARKGVGELITAMAQLPGRTLAIAGGPEDAVDELRTRIAAMGLDDRVSLTGPLPAARVAAFLSEGRVGVCPLPVGHDTVSDRFTSPLKLLQMMALGMAVVATDTAPVREIATHGRDVLLVPPNSPEDLARGIAVLLSDSDLAGSLGVQARCTAARFTWDRRAEALEALIAVILAHRTGRRARAAGLCRPAITGLPPASRESHSGAPQGSRSRRNRRAGHPPA